MEKNVIQKMVHHFAREIYTDFSNVAIDIADIVLDCYEEDEDIKELVDHEVDDNLFKNEKWIIMEHYCEPEHADLDRALRSFKVLIENVVVACLNY